MIMHRTMTSVSRSLLRGSTTRFYATAAASAAETSSNGSDGASSTGGIPLKAGPPSPLPGTERKTSAIVESLVEQIATLSLTDVVDLNVALKKRLNIPDTPFMPAGFAMAAPSASAAPSAAEEAQDDIGMPQKIAFAVKLTGFDSTKKIALIKQIRDVIPGLNLVQAKKFVEGVPVQVKNDLGKTEAEDLKSALEKVGGTVEIV